MEILKNIESGAGYTVPSGAAKTGTIITAITAEHLAVNGNLHVQQDTHFHSSHVVASKPTLPIHGNIPSRLDRPFIGRGEQLKAMDKILGDPEREAAIVLHGPPGVGKTELAHEYARRQAERYPGGRFYVDASGGTPVRLAEIGRTILGLDFAPDLSVPLQCERTLQQLAYAPALVIYDNVRVPEAIEPWLPAAGMPCHVIMTSVVDRWDDICPALSIYPLTKEESVALVTALTDAETCAQHGMPLIEGAGGLPVQLVPASTVLARAIRRGQGGIAQSWLSPKAASGFLSVYDQLGSSAQLLLQAAALRNGYNMTRSDLANDLLEATGWGQIELEQHLDACLDLHLMEGGGSLRMHQLIASFLINQPAPQGLTATVEQVRKGQWQQFNAAADSVIRTPNRTDLMAVMLGFALDPDWWESARIIPDVKHYDNIGNALIELGQFAAAQSWFTHAIRIKKIGDLNSRSDHGSVGESLHQFGLCLSEMGRHQEAIDWFKQAVAEMEKGDVNGLINYENIGVSLHQIGYCLSQQGLYSEAQGWYEQAVSSKEKGDERQIIHHQSLALSLHQVGYCLFGLLQYDEAMRWLKRAMAYTEKGDVCGRIDYGSFGLSQHLVGDCLVQQGLYAEAQPWYERAVSAAEKGDVHGRIDHESLGLGLHQVGYCLSQQGYYPEALPWFERAVSAKETGDLHNRVDHTTLGISLHRIGYCLLKQDRHDDVLPWFKRAVSEKQKGDIYSRVDYTSLRLSLHQVGDCLSWQCQDAAALSWFEQAVAAAEKGNVYGCIDNEGLSISLRAVGDCLTRLGQREAALPWLERATEMAITKSS